MRAAVLVSPIAKTIPFVEDAIYIGVDAGVIKIMEAGIRPSFAVGDFDSMKQEELETIENEIALEKHPVMKDESDMELALRIAYEKGCAPIYLVGALGKRIDHTIANLRLLMYRYPQAIIWEPEQKLFVLKEGRHTLENDYKNVSFFAIEPSIITLEGFLYPLAHRFIQPKEIYTLSNSIIGPSGIVTIEKGSFLCIVTNE